MSPSRRLALLRARLGFARAFVLAMAALSGCKDPLPDGPVCGLHSASAPVLSVDGKRTFGVGAKLLATDQLDVRGWALLECFTGASRALHKEKVKVADLREWKVETATLPRRALKDGVVQQVDSLPRPVSARYSSNRFTPESAKAAAGGDTSTADYFAAFFTPNGIENLTGGGSAPDGPRRLPPPPNRVRVPFIHAAELGEGEAVLEVTDDVAFAETDDLATAALLEGKTYPLGRTVRLLLPDGAQAKLSLPGGQKVKLDGPMDLKLR